MAELTEYTWIFGFSVVVAFMSAFGIGANDVANSFASSVGAKAITMLQAVLIAAVCEFAGASLLGAGVTSTIRSNIAKVGDFAETPDLLMYGMFAVMITAATWDNLACHLEFPVSTTHTTVGAIVGMALAIYGKSAVVWSDEIDDFPYITGFVVIVLSWVCSPIAAGICVIILYGLLRTFVFRHKNSFQISTWVLPFLVGLTFFVITVFIIQTGNKNKTWTPSTGDGKAIWIGFVVAVPLGILSLLLIKFYLQQRIERLLAERQAKLDEVERNGDKVPIVPEDDMSFMDRAWEKFMKSPFGNNPVVRTITYGANYKVHDVIEENEAVAAVWAHAEVHDVRTEALFRYLQVFTACVMSFAHGSNDVANAMGPFSAVYAIWKTGKVPTNSPVPEWILLLGGGGIVVGLATYGYKIMRVLGVKTVKLTNTRGFCAELSTAIVVVVASRYGLPVSTTQVITGAILTIGLFEGLKGVNWKMTLKIVFGWILTILIAGFLCAGITAFGVYSPNKVSDGRTVTVYADMDAFNADMISELNTTALTTNNVALVSQVAALNATRTAYLAMKGSAADLTTVWNDVDATFNVFNATECAPQLP